MQIYASDLDIEGSLLKGENPLPIFRDRQKDKHIISDGTLTEESIENIGYEIGLRLLPYKFQDRYDRNKTNIKLNTVVIENDKIKAVFLCGYGARLYSMEDKETGKDILFKNPVFQTANLATRNAWFSGGIEWNVSQFGHSLQTCEPLFFAIVKDKDDKEFLRVYEFERTKRIYYQMDFRLIDGDKNLYLYVKIINDDNYKKPMYWWTNIAVREEKNIRVFSATDDIVYIYPDSVGSTENSIKKFGASKLPKTPFVKDGSYPLNFEYSSEYFFQTSKKTISPWEAAVYNDGFLFFERSTNKLRYRKMFCWGNLRGGRKWESFLSRGNEGEYIELQAGIMPTQVNGFDMDANSIIEFVQAFSFDYLKDDYDIIFAEDYAKAREKVESIVNRNMDENHLNNLIKKYSEESDLPISNILSYGKGWGALEDIRREKYNLNKSPKSLKFPKDSLKEDCMMWINLLENGYLDELDSEDTPISYMLDFKDLLESCENKNAAVLVHLGIIYYENFMEDKALELWLKSIDIKPTAIAYRNISTYYKDKKDYEKALYYMEKSIDVFGNKEADEAFIVEYFYLLDLLKKYNKIIQLYEKYGYCEKTAVYAARSYLALKEYEKLKKIFNMEQITIREGENYILDVYFEYIAKLKSEREGIEFNNELIKKLRKEVEAPENLDFRMVKI
ncbi:hypothetical protein BHAMNSH16_01105 [Brachyspira hampsonii]|uniref:DUF5107 domain-containing protein n=3 Tax=Brachyspira hampsonii TaxID=1287055 RepID=A0AAC9TTV9_9SPIR|nr:DUF5107 domain-containing protein [Brachyspira hampsonii]ASJ20331.1 hypothetical protein BHAMNSH16_01105 [Brachyspira hampsonii]OEJ16344.1 hypothetical protein A9496_01330 [Brachyspira hampsonii]